MGKSAVGSYPVVVQDQEEALSLRLQDEATGVDLTITTPRTITIYDLSGNQIVAETAVASSGAVAEYKRTWEAATFRRGVGYRAVWKLTSGATLYTRETFFQIARRRFLSQLTDADLTAINPYLAAQIPNLAPYRARAWREIERRATTKVGEYAGNVFFPERFLEAHELLTLAQAFFALSFDGAQSSEDWAKYNEMRTRGLEVLQEALSAVDFDANDNGKIDAADLARNFAGIEIRR
jgi:hypothetical protein